MNKEIKLSQWMFVMVGYITGAVLLGSFLASKQDAWIVFIVALILIMPMLWCFVKIAKKFPGKNLVEILDIVYGPVLGKIIAVLYIIYFFMLFFYNSKDVSVFFSSFFMPETPYTFFLIAMTACCGYAIKQGIPNFARVCTVIVIIMVCSILLTLLLSINLFHLQNMEPILQTPAKDMVQSIVLTTVLIFGEVVLFLMIAPFIRDTQKLPAYTYGGVAISAVLFLAITLRNIWVLGPSGAIFLQSSFESTRMIALGDFFNRIEIIIALNYLCMMLIRICVMYYAAVKGIAQLLKLKTYAPLIVPVGILMIAASLMGPYSPTMQEMYASKYHPFWAILYVIIFPLLTLLIAVIRRLQGAGDKQVK